ncbi:MAG: YHYH protein [Saprospiraceae bacterium]
MNKIIYTISIFLFPFLLNAQCDTAAIYANTTSNAVCFDTTFSKVRNCYSNNIPDHDDSYNSSFTVEASEEEYSMCLYPDTANTFTPLYEEVETPAGCNYTYQFGVGLNGIGYTPNSNEYFDIIDPGTGLETGEVNIEWHKEARYMFNAKFGNNGGHLNAFGSYHYHDIPVDYFTDSLEITIAAHSSIVGYAADGFPIYYKFVFSDANDTSSALVALSSGYTLISGTRPGDGYSAPDGSYSGLYYEDYEYTTTTLDSCNGRWGKTPDFPDGTYYYVLTDNYPYIPRCFKGTVLDNTFRSLSNCPASTASTDCSDGSVEGCTDPFSCNYNPDAVIDDGSCDYNYSYDTLTITSCGSYQGPSGAFYSVDGTYSDTLVVGGSCDTVYNINLTVYENPSATRNGTNPTTSGGSDGKILFSGLSGTPPFQFSIDSAVTYSSPMPPNFTGLTEGEYWTVIKGGNGCEVFEKITLGLSLPVELISFNTILHEQKIELKWITASEINSSHFEIEKSYDGVNFEFLERISSHHNSQNQQEYHFYDFDLLKEYQYYRLKMVDFDGEYKYSNITVANVKALLQKHGIILFPNPTSEDLTIRNGNGNAILYNHIGKKMKTLDISSSNYKVNISELPSGKYFIQFIKEQGESRVKSFVKIQK